MYNRYIGGKRYIQHEPGDRSEWADIRQETSGREAEIKRNEALPVHRTAAAHDVKKPASERKRPSGNISGGLESALSSFLPGDMDAGDLLLIAVLFLLYVESRDEDFLIILGALAVTFFDII